MRSPRGEKKEAFDTGGMKASPVPDAKAVSGLKGPRNDRLLQGLRFPLGKPHFVGGIAAWCSAVTLPLVPGACRHGPETEW